LKEALVIPAQALLLGIFLQYYFGEKMTTGSWVGALVLFVILAVLKYFVAALFLALVLAVLATRKILAKEGKWYSEVGVLLMLLFIAGGLVSLLHPNLWPLRIAEVIYANYEAYLATAHPGAIVTYPGLAPDLLSMLMALPKAVFTGLFLPLLPVQGSMVTYFSVAENWLLLSLTLVSLGTIVLPKSREWRLLFWAGLLFVLLAAGLIALSTPNLGTLARYKTSYLLVALPLIMAGLFRRYRKLVD
jgi:hypothetical protein